MRPARGVFSSRWIHHRLLRVLAAGNEPDFRTIANFRTASDA
jgi:hypothetical protein